MSQHDFSAQRGLFASRILAAGCCFLPSLASAHPGHYHPPGEIDEFEALGAGFMHPLTGTDHLVLALAAGWLAFAWKGGRARVPALAFLGALVVGAFFGRGMLAGAGLEMALAITLVAAGVGFFAGKRLRIGAFSVATALAGLVHGVAHGSEAVGKGGFLAYTAGFSVGTALLVATGGLLQLAASTTRPAVSSRLAGTFLLVFGSISLIQAL